MSSWMVKKLGQRGSSPRQLLGNTCKNRITLDMGCLGTEHDWVSQAGAAQRRLVAAGFAMRRQQNHRISSDNKIEKKHLGARNNNSFIEGIGDTATGAKQRLECQCRGKSAAGAAPSSGWSGEACRGQSRHGGLGSNTSDKLGSVGSSRQQARRLVLAGFVVTDRGSSGQSNNVGVDVKLAARKQRLSLFNFLPSLLSCLFFERCR
ncbi:hypothetical protein NL676_008861 [Syzygium grande]|nr:hypothetical protein NL676_008861 [Syzygium grande]